MYRVSAFEVFLPMEGIEPTRPCGHWILSPARLPVPPHRPNEQGASFKLFRQKRKWLAARRRFASGRPYP